MGDFDHSRLPEAEESICEFEFAEIVVAKKKRFIGNPNDAMARLQKRFVAQLHKAIENNTRISFESVTGSLPGCSPMQNAAHHQHGKYFYSFDIRDAFPSVDIPRLAVALFVLAPELGSALDILRFLERFCESPRGGLVVGSPSSPLLFNIYCAVWIDGKLRRLFSRKGGKLTRYIDDVVFSSDRPISFRLRKKLRQVVLDAGLTINRRKSTLLTAERGAVSITGVQRFPEGVISPTEEFLLKIDEALGVWISDLTKGERKEYEQKLRGMSEYLHTFRADECTRRVLHLQQRVSARVRMLRRRKRSLAKKQKSVTAARPLVRRVKFFPPGFLDELRGRIPLEKLVEKKVKLQKRSGGREYFGLCPFHNEKTPSFSVAARKKFYHCFGCGAHGDVFEFLIQTENLTFPEAVYTLARWCNLPVP